MALQLIEAQNFTLSVLVGARPFSRGIGTLLEPPPVDDVTRAARAFGAAVDGLDVPQSVDDVGHEERDLGVASALDDVTAATDDPGPSLRLIQSAAHKALLAGAQSRRRGRQGRHGAHPGLRSGLTSRGHVRGRRGRWPCLAPGHHSAASRRLPRRCGGAASPAIGGGLRRGPT